MANQSTQNIEKLLSKVCSALLKKYSISEWNIINNILNSNQKQRHLFFIEIELDPYIYAAINNNLDKYFPDNWQQEQENLETYIQNFWGDLNWYLNRIRYSKDSKDELMVPMFDFNTFNFNDNLQKVNSPSPGLKTFKTVPGALFFEKTKVTFNTNIRGLKYLLNNIPPFMKFKLQKKIEFHGQGDFEFLKTHYDETLEKIFSSAYDKFKEIAKEDPRRQNGFFNPLDVPDEDRDSLESWKNAPNPEQIALRNKQEQELKQKQATMIPRKPGMSVDQPGDNVLTNPKQGLTGKFLASWNEIGYKNV